MATAKYQTLSNKSESEPLDSSFGDDTEVFLHETHRQKKANSAAVRVLSITCAALAFTLIALVLYLLKYPRSSMSDNECARQLSIQGWPSCQFRVLEQPFDNVLGPALDAVEYKTFMYKGAQDDKNPYKGHPSAELDTAWGQLTAGEQFPRVMKNIS
jgi:hypothetical protein